jgi:hypothetical protein
MATRPIKANRRARSRAGGAAGASPRTATEVYGLVAAPQAPAIAGAPKGLPGLSSPRALGAGDGLWLVVADAPLPDYGAEAIGRRLGDLAWVSACAVAHERVVEHFGAAGTIMPMKLFTLFAGDARAVEHITGQRERLERLLARVAGCREWGVRVHLDERRARAAAATQAAPAAGGTGTAFLEQKRRQQQTSRQALASAQARADEIHEALAARARGAVRREPLAAEPGMRLLLDAAFLVPEADAASFEAEVGRGSDVLAQLGCETVVTGPWPPYNFVAEAP